MFHADREQFSRFVHKHPDRIRHCDALHAKVIFSSTLAVIGSANFTSSGFFSQHEMSIQLDSPPILKQLQQWFLTLWEAAGPVSLDQVNPMVAALPPKPTDSSAHTMRSRVWRPAAKCTAPLSLSPTIAHPQQTYWDKLRATVGRFPSRQWASAFFDLVRRAVAETKMGPNDPRWNMNFSNGLTVSINHRYVLTADRRQSNEIAFMLPRDFPLPSSLTARLTHTEYFETRRNRRKTKTQEPTLLGFLFPEPTFALPSQLLTAWITCLRDQLLGGNRAQDHRWHKRIVYEAAVNETTRQRLLTEAFGD